MCGSALKILCGRLRYFPGTSIDKSLAHATGRLRQFAKQRNLSLTLRKLTKNALTWGDGYPELRAKGYDTYIVLKWLVHELEMNNPCSADAAEQAMLNEMRAALWAADSWVGMLSHAGMHLTENQQLHKTVVGGIFMSLYVSLAQRAITEAKRLWRVRPKFHMLHHCILEDRASRLNPVLSSTWKDEDFIKRTMRIKKLTHRRTATASTLQRWLLGLLPKLQDALSKL